MEELVQLPARYSDADDEVVESVTTGTALALIASLPHDQAETVLLRLVVGLDINATAAVLATRPGGSGRGPPWSVLPGRPGTRTFRPVTRNAGRPPAAEEVR